MRSILVQPAPRDAAPRAETAAAKRILYVHNGSDLYGASRSLLRLVARLDRKKFEPHVILPEVGPLCRALRLAGVPYTIQPSLAVISRKVLGSWRMLPFLGRVPASVLVLVRFIRRQRIDLVHTNVATVLTSGAAARLAGVPHVWHVRDSFEEFGRLWKAYSRYLLWSSAMVVCVSAAIARQFSRASAKVSVVHDGLPVEEFEGVSDRQVAAFRQRYGLGQRKLVGMVGRIKFQRKGQDVFVEAIARLKNKLEDVGFVIIGSPFPGNEDHLQRLRELISRLDLSGHVVLTGDVEDVKAALGSLDVLVLASCRPEPFAGVVLEAMALGVPVIGTRTGGTIEQIDDGVSGILVEPNDPRTLAEAIERLLADRALKESIRKAARARVSEQFSFDHTRSKLEQIYEQCLRHPERDRSA